MKEWTQYDEQINKLYNQISNIKREQSQLI